MTAPRPFKFVLAGLCALSISAAVSASYAHGEPPAGAFGKALPLSSLGKTAIGVSVETVEKSNLPMEITVPGKIEVIPTRQFDQHAPLSGRVSSVAVWPGEQVKEGQVLAIIDSLEMNQLAAQFLQSKLDLESEYQKQKTALDEEVRQAENRLELAEANKKRNHKLFEQRIAPQKDVLAADTEYDLATTRLKTATQNRAIILRTLRARQKLVLIPLRQRLKMLGVDEESIEDMLTKQKTITSVPVEAARSGVITAISASPGKSIDPSVSLFTIADLSKVWATAEVYEDDMSRMKVGEAVHVKVHALKEGRVQGVLTYIGSQVDPQMRTLPVRAEVANPDLQLKPDMFADLYIQTSESVPMIALPKDAVIDQNNHSLVFVETKEGYQPTVVRTGKTIGDEIEIVDGLHVGDRVVTRGAFQLGAELMKQTEGESSFAAPTEGERIEADDADKDKHADAINMQTLIIAAGAAFLFGIVLAAILLLRSNKVHISIDMPDGKVRPVSPSEQKTTTETKTSL